MLNIHMSLSKIKSRYGIDPYYLFIIALICLLYALVFQPVSMGDSSVYVTLAKQFLGTDTTHVDLSNRSPFYSTILSIFIKIFGEKNFLFFVVYFQYLLIFVCGLLIYKIFDEIIENKYIPALTGFVFLFNISTITYGFIILTETLTLFLFLCITFITVKYSSTQNRKGFLFLLGFLTGLLILTRFNTLLIPLCLIFCIVVVHFLEFKWKKIGTLLIHISLFLVPLVFILNIWCYRNYLEYNFYFLFPPAYGNQRFIEPALVNENTHVSSENEPLLKIFLRAKKKYLARKQAVKNDSLQKYIPIKVPHETTSGYKIYKIAMPELFKHFHIEGAANPGFLLGEKLRGFFKEVAAQNKFKLFMLRVYSFINSFRASIASLPAKFDVNLNILPPVFFTFYKVAFFILVVSFLIFTPFYLISALKNKKIRENYIQISLLVLIFYFPAINFLAATISDANRFKYPSEPLILGMLIYYIYYFFKRRKNRGKGK